MTDKRLVLSTASSMEESKKIARELVERRLAACVNIISQVESVYRWQGKVEEAQECLLVIKTRKAAFDRLRDLLQQMHSYEIPECITLEVVEGSLPYLNWIEDCVD
jgi:periplasmic divalent cation tolerance protein